MSWAELERRKYASGGRILLLLTQLRQMWQRRSGARTPNVQWIVADNSDMATTHVCDVNRLLISLDSDWAGTVKSICPALTAFYPSLSSVPNYSSKA